MAAMADQEAYAKMAACDADLMAEAECHIEWNPIDHDDADDSISQGSNISIDSWELNFNELRELMAADYPNGGFVSVDQYTPDLGDWISRQRVQYRSRKGRRYACPLSDDRMKKLDDIGFWWEDDDRGQGSTKTSLPDDTDGVAAVIQVQQLKQKKERPPSSRQKKKRPSRQSKEWTRYYEELKNHRKSHPPSVPGQCPECSEDLGRWVKDQRRRYWEKQANGSSATLITNTISAFHIQELENIGFPWGEDPNPPPKKQRVYTTSNRHFIINRKQIPAEAPIPQSKKQKTAKKIAEENNMSAEESCNSDNETLGWLTQDEEESHHSSNDCSTNNSPDDDGTLDTAGYSTSNKSSLSAHCSVSEATMSESQETHNTFQGTTTSTRMGADIHENRRAQRQTNTAQKLQKEIRALQDRVKQLEKQNDILRNGTEGHKQRYRALRHAHKIERERRIEAEAKLTNTAISNGRR